VTGFCSGYSPSVASRCSLDDRESESIRTQVVSLLKSDESRRAFINVSCTALLNETCVDVGGVVRGLSSPCVCCTFLNFHQLRNCAEDDECQYRPGIPFGLKPCFQSCITLLSASCAGADATKVDGLCLKWSTGSNATFAPALSKECVSMDPVMLDSSLECAGIWALGKFLALDLHMMSMLIVLIVGGCIGLCVDCTKFSD
jgi:hypothetical protein